MECIATVRTAYSMLSTKVESWIEADTEKKTALCDVAVADYRSALCHHNDWHCKTQSENKEFS